MAKTLSAKEVQGYLGLQGAIAVIFGIAAVFWPGLTTLTLIYLVGAYLLVAGVIHTAHGLSGVVQDAWGLVTVALGLVELGFGVYILRHPGITLGTFIVLIGFAFILRGVIEIVSALFDSTRNKDRAWTFLGGLLALVVGIVVLYQKASAGIAFVWVLGVYAIVVGTLLLVSAKHLTD